MAAAFESDLLATAQAPGLNIPMLYHGLHALECQSQEDQILNNIRGVDLLDRHCDHQKIHMNGFKPERHLIDTLQKGQRKVGQNTITETSDFLFDTSSVLSLPDVNGVWEDASSCLVLQPSMTSSVPESLTCQLLEPGMPTWEVDAHVFDFSALNFIEPLQASVGIDEFTANFGHNGQLISDTCDRLDWHDETSQEDASRLCWPVDRWFCDTCFKGFKHQWRLRYFSEIHCHLTDAEICTTVSTGRYISGTFGVLTLAARRKASTVCRTWIVIGDLAIGLQMMGLLSIAQLLDVDML